MKRKVLKYILLFLLTAALLIFCSCKASVDDAEPKMFTIQYSDDSGIYSISVEQGQLYSINSIPSRYGYEFIGLFDAEEGGTQYVNSKGGSVSAFTNNESLVLYAQFKPKEYTVVLNYQGAEVIGSRSIPVNYSQMLSNLPTNLTMDNKYFVGWFTAPDKGGNQIADQYGVIPNKARINETNFDLSDPNGFINLYAGFKGEEHLVTFYVDGIREPEEQLIEHGTFISKVITALRNAEGMAILTWSKNSNKTEIFDGKVLDDMVLYSVDFAPVLEFDSNGGSNVQSIIARKGTDISLPTPIRENYTFAGWYTIGGKKYTAVSMPVASEKLVAHWNAKLIFNTNGGTAVQDISEEVGTKISLPTTEKDGYMFAGWYTEKGQKYSSTSMPETSIKLIAKYYKTKSKRYVLINASTGVGVDTSVPKTNNYCSVLDLSELYDADIDQVKITVSYKGSCHSWDYISKDLTINMNWYSTGTASDGYKVWSHSDTIPYNDNGIYTFTHSTFLQLTTQKYYVAYYSIPLRRSSYGDITDFWVDVSYPDTTTLY